jgi:hypothetical protein
MNCSSILYHGILVTIRRPTQRVTDRRRRNNESGASVEDGSAPLKSGALAVNRDGVHVTLPEALRVNVVEGHKCGWVKLGRIKSAECDLAVIFLVRQTGYLVRGNRSGNKTCCRQGLYGSRFSLLGKARLCQAHQPVELYSVAEKAVSDART